VEDEAMLMDEANEKAHEPAEGHGMLKIALILFGVAALLPLFGIGVYRNASGDRCFDLWYLIALMLVALFIMHEFIAPLPPKETAE
jgi:hypothetical protein